MPDLVTRLKMLTISAVVMLVGCSSAPDHSNTLIFATDTKFAIDVGVTTTSQTPEFTVGYKRQEAVWLPLIANKKVDGDWVPVECTTNCKYESTETTDTYSVLASFGAEFGGEGSAENSGASEGSDASLPKVKGTTKASGGIAQYFATGLAAQELARKGGAALVTVQSGNTQPQLSPAEVIMQRTGVSQEVAERIAKEAKQAVLEEDSKVVTAMAKLAPGGQVDTNKIKTVVAAVKAADSAYSRYGVLNGLENATTTKDVNVYLTSLAQATAIDGKPHPMDVLIAEAYK